MKRMCGVLACAVAAVGLVAGCEWESSSDKNSWSGSYNWVNFSGTYRNSNGGMLVTDYTTTPSKPGSTNTLSNTESGGTLPANALSASGSTKHRQLTPGSVTVRIGSDIALSDDGAGALTGVGGSGSVSYAGGTWSFTLQDHQASVFSRKISVSYAYSVANDGSAGGNARSGASGRSIYSFVVVQQGQNLTITDNNGARYTGRLGELRSTSGMTPDNSKATAEGGKVLPKDGDTIVAPFNCKGTSAAGMGVTITGTFQGTVATGVFTGRTMQGTWIETGGKTGDINGTANSVSISTSSSTSDETADTAS